MKKLKNIMPSRRRLIQLYAALLYNAHIKGFISGNIYTGKLKFLCVPGLNCYSCPGAVSACPLGALQNALAASGTRAPTYILGILMLYGIILGRTVCGFICPFGLIQELLHKIPTPKLKKSRLTRALSGIKYILLILLVLVLPFWNGLKKLPLPAFCKYVCPAGTLEGAVALLAHPENREMFSMLGMIFLRKSIILLLLIAACIFIYRAFCRFLCPLGAIYGLFARVNIIGVKLDKPKCIDCGKCIGVCGMDIRHVGDHECIHCGECIDSCPTKAISFRAGKIILRESATEKTSPEKLRKARRLSIIACSAALLLLAGALFAANRAEPAPVSSPSSGAIGSAAPELSLPIYGSEGGQFRLSEHSGKTVVINFWATWCNPCVEELPYFDRLCKESGESIAFVAVHSELVTEDVENWLSSFDYSLPFALDESGEAAKAFGISSMLPHTVIISPEGNIVYNAAGSLTYEELARLIKQR